MGKKVLAIDLDPQGNLSFSLGIDDEDAYTIYDVFKGNCDISDAVQKGGICDVIASNILLSGVELELTGRWARVYPPGTDGDYPRRVRLHNTGYAARRCRCSP